MKIVLGLTLLLTAFNAFALFDAEEEARQAASYREARRYLFGKIALRKDSNGYFIRDVYCRKVVRDGVGLFKIPNPNKMNCEHTWPQSKFNRKKSIEKQRNDLHHLFAVDSKTNSSRSNHMFAEVNGWAANGGCNASMKGYAHGTHQIAFMPPKEHRGNVARAMFYFSDQYEMPIGPVQEMYLRKWHREDPVDRAERRRNDLVEQYQGNRNKFIDNPELVEMRGDF